MLESPPVRFMLMAPVTQSLTDLLLEWRDGDEAALDRLTPLVYDELRRLAHHYMQCERTGHTLQTTALVNEAYLRLAADKKIEWQNRTHFFAVMARVMRHVLTDHARRRSFAKRGGSLRQVSLSEIDVMSQERAAELIVLD